MGPRNWLRRLIIPAMAVLAGSVMLLLPGPSRARQNKRLREFSS
jgi:hypothetical protein